ncbi:7-carboxy-7-deazaguanine synthase [Stieleria maiorica]|uniref:7-carboxy-7-deazaguanine synthase n=1 Tax=Stieleria maiorica TaxID=2795974 RepID=A0A5B9MG15_9BACT|nr:7-carboxy-7-deazaguanine synthase QueE [Stieleria maiorica]QEF99046.1 7-carboxy-7-deazaguanine synthase [Stieleria maiorica]
MGKPQFSHATAESTRGPDHAQLLVSETFTSRQGEGRLTGTDSFFIRTSGCNLRCWFCDTPYASWNPSGDRQTIESLLDAARQSGVEHVVLTGGEPLLSPAVTELSRSLMDSGFHLTIETAGTIDKPIPCDLLSLSPKLADSTPDPGQHPRWSGLHEQRRMPIETMRTLIDAALAHQVKFVVGDRSQFDEIRQVVDSLGVTNDDVFLMPQGVTNAQMDAAIEWLRPLTEAAGYQYCDRMQIRWFGNRRGT